MMDSTRHGKRLGLGLIGIGRPWGHIPGEVPAESEARAFLQRPAAEALARVQRALKAKGYGLLVFDGYRPWAVTKQFWDLTPADKKVFVANPKNGPRPNPGGNCFPLALALSPTRFERLSRTSPSKKSFFSRVSRSASIFEISRTSLMTESKCLAALSILPN